MNAVLFNRREADRLAIYKHNVLMRVLLNLDGRAIMKYASEPLGLLVSFFLGGYTECWEA